MAPPGIHGATFRRRARRYLRELRVLAPTTFLLLLPPAICAGTDGFGGMVGVSGTFGTIRTRLGLVAKGYYAGDSLQLNASLGVHYNFATFGPPVTGPELQAGIGGVAAWGDRDMRDNRFLSAVGNQTGRENSVALAWNTYRDRIGTSQQTGTFALQSGALQLASENDFLAGKGEDRFRTGALSATIRNGNTMVGIRTLLWTGDTKGAPKVLDTDYPAEYGYRDMRKARYGAYSHGTLSLQVQRVSSALQSFSLDIGADAERIRHAVQNRLIHDLVFLPKGWVRTENAHVPMLDAEGKPYLFHDAQRVAPPELFLDVSLNPPLFY